MIEERRCAADEHKRLRSESESPSIHTRRRRSRSGTVWRDWRTCITWPRAARRSAQWEEADPGGKRKYEMSLGSAPGKKG